MEWSTEWSNAVFSLTERDARWGRVRRLMDAAQLDVIVVLPCTNSHDRGQADARYLTQLGENSDETTVVFERDGEVVAWHSRGGVWPSGNWVGTVRATRRGTGGRAAVDYLRSRGFRRGTIGIAGMTSSLLAHVRAVEGEVNWQSVEIIREAFPEARVVSATPVLGEARYQKSEEEIDFLRKGTAVAEATLKAVERTARPGVAERTVFGEMMKANAEAGGSFTPMFGWISGPLGHTYHRVEQPTFRQLQTGDVLSLEVEGRWGGHIAQIDQMFYLGETIPADLRDGMALALEAFERVIERMKPGVTVGELYDSGQIHGMGGRGVTRLLMHGRGTGDDGPLVTTNITPELLNLEIRENCCFIVKPSTWVDSRQDFGHWGETVVVRKHGAERLGTRQPDITRCW